MDLRFDVLIYFLPLDKRTYGHVVVYKGLFCQERFFTTDPLALRHILITKPYLYPKVSQIVYQTLICG